MAVISEFSFGRARERAVAEALDEEAGRSQIAMQTSVTAMAPNQVG